EIGWQPVGTGLATRYFAGHEGPAVPNNSVAVLRLLAELAAATGETRYLQRAPAMLTFLAQAQRTSGELPYVFGPMTRARLEHFQCFQYNAFQCLDLLRYQEVSGDDHPRAIVAGVIRFLADGVGDRDRCPYACT